MRFTRREREREREGFTLAELLVVVAIIGILVAISIPIFSAQLAKARLATNKANVRAARAIGTSQFYEDLADGKLGGSKYAFYTYDVASGTITNTYYSKGDDDSSSYGTYNKKAYTYYEKAKNGEVCDTIWIFAEEDTTDSQGGTFANIQTCPYYEGDEVGDGYAGASSNDKTQGRFGPYEK